MSAQVLYFALMESRFSHLPQDSACQLAQSREKVSDHPFAKIMNMCLFLIKREGLSAFELERMVSLIFSGTALAAEPDAEGRGRNGGREGAKGRM